MGQRRRRVQADQEIARRGQRFMHVLQLLGQRLVRTEERRHMQAEQDDRPAFGAQRQPAQHRRGDHEGVERQVHQPRQPFLPYRRRRSDVGRRARAPAHRQPDHDERKHAQAEQEVQRLEAGAQVAALGGEPAKLHAGVHGGEQHQHQPVQADDPRAVADVRILECHVLLLQKCVPTMNLSVQRSASCVRPLPMPRLTSKCSNSWSTTA